MMSSHPPTDFPLMKMLGTVLLPVSSWRASWYSDVLSVGREKERENVTTTTHVGSLQHMYVSKDQRVQTHTQYNDCLGNKIVCVPRSYHTNWILIRWEGLDMMHACKCNMHDIVHAPILSKQFTPSTYPVDPAPLACSRHSESWRAAWPAQNRERNKTQRHVCTRKLTIVVS